MLSNHYTIAQVQQIINATGDIVKEDTISVLLTDSRRINNPAGGLFFALSGRRNGHEFIAEAYFAQVNEVDPHYSISVKLGLVGQSL